MFSVFKNYPPIVLEAKKAKFKPNFVLQLLIFLGVFLVITFIQSFPFIIYGIYVGARAVINQEISMDKPDGFMNLIHEVTDALILPSLFATCVITILAIVYCRYIEKRSLYSMGFTKEKAFMDYGIGLVVGFVMFGACVIISWLSGTLQYNGFTIGNGLALFFVFLIGFIIQGMSEEVLLRGYLMISIASRNSILLAILANSLLFSLLHVFNSGVSLLGLINITLFGIFVSIYTLKTNSIWGVCAIHTIWNFAQGNIFGIKVSGINTAVSLFSFTPTGEGTLINGGEFGLEGGLAVTIVSVISIMAVLFIKGRMAANTGTQESDHIGDMGTAASDS